MQTIPSLQKWAVFICHKWCVMFWNVWKINFSLFVIFLYKKIFVRSFKWFWRKKKSEIHLKFVQKKNQQVWRKNDKFRQHFFFLDISVLNFVLRNKLKKIRKLFCIRFRTLRILKDNKISHFWKEDGAVYIKLSRIREKIVDA